MNRHDQVEGFVLAGGDSTRMGSDKAVLEIAGVPLLVRLAHFVEPLVQRVTVVGAPARYSHLALRIVADEYPGLGPLGGLATALHISSAVWNLVAACDLPYLNPEWFEWLIQRAEKSTADAVVPRSTKGLEPLCAMYRSGCHGFVDAAIERGVRKVTDALAGINMELITSDQGEGFDFNLLFQNMNTPEDYAEALKRLELEPRS